MDIPPIPDDDVLAEPVRTRLMRALAALRRPATTHELAALVGRHPNTVRVQLNRLAEAGLLERRRAPQARGRPRQEWAIAPRARPAGQAPHAYEQLSEWLVRAIAKTGQISDIETGGREIGRELAPEHRHHTTTEALHDVFSALGFAPSEQPHAGGMRFVLGNCPYRDAVLHNREAVCGLHRGMTEGLLDELDPDARLVGFVARDPYRAGCVVDVAMSRSRVPDGHCGK
jgi:predicted ArsR family transcriptional regulator